MTASDGGLQKVNVVFRSAAEKIKPLRGRKRQRWRLKSAGCLFGGQGRSTADVFVSSLSIKKDLRLLSDLAAAPQSHDPSLPLVGG